MPIKFTSEVDVFRLEVLNEPEISDSGPPCLKSLPEYLCSGFHRPQPDLKPRTVYLEASTLPRHHWGGLRCPLMRETMLDSHIAQLVMLLTEKQTLIEKQSYLTRVRTQRDVALAYYEWEGRQGFLILIRLQFMLSRSTETWLGTRRC